MPLTVPASVRSPAVVVRPTVPAVSGPDTTRPAASVSKKSVAADTEPTVTIWLLPFSTRLPLAGALQETGIAIPFDNWFTPV